MRAAADGGLYLGLISGTSADGIDAALVEFSETRPGAPLSLRLRFARTYALPEALRAEVLRVSQAEACLDLDAFGELDTRVGQAFAEAAHGCLRDAGVAATAVRAIGSHGQTLRHRPRGPAPFTLQIGDGNVITEQTGITTVADFRRRDVAAGGQGAPLMPAFHAAVLRSDDEVRAVLNLGGIGNLTLLSGVAPVRGFDTGPANGLMDAWHAWHCGGPYDPDGAFARSGECDADLLESLLAEPWLALPAPKSTGRDHFNLDWLEARLAGRTRRPEDVQATLCAFSARSIADALRREQADTRRLLVCGGGVHNGTLMSALQAELPTLPVQSTASVGLDPDMVEAMGFAWLARETLAGRPGNLPEVTGARGARVLGTVFPA